MRRVKLWSGMLVWGLLALAVSACSSILESSKSPKPYIMYATVKQTGYSSG